MGDGPNYQGVLAIPFVHDAASLAAVSHWLFWIAVLIVLVVSAILYYHWIRYGVGIIGTFFIMVTYTVGTAILLLAGLGFMAQL